MATSLLKKGDESRYRDSRALQPQGGQIPNAIAVMDKAFHEAVRYAGQLPSWCHGALAIKTSVLHLRFCQIRGREVKGAGGQRDTIGSKQS